MGVSEKVVLVRESPSCPGTRQGPVSKLPTIMLREMLGGCLKDCKMRAEAPTEVVSREESRKNEFRWSAIRNVNVTLV